MAAISFVFPLLMFILLIVIMIQAALYASDAQSL